MRNATTEQTMTRMARLDDPWLSVRQAAAHAGVCEKTIRRAYLTRRVQHTRVGRSVRFKRSSFLEEYRKRHCESEKLNMDSLS